MKHAASFLYSVLSGVCIAVGGVAFLSCESKIVGAVFFCLGIFTICTFGLNLYTGKIGYVFENPPSYIGFLLWVWLGNLAGAVTVGLAVQATRISVISEKAAELCQTKLNDTPLSIFILSVFCNLLVFITVDNFKNNPHEVGKYLGIFLGIVTFILCGFEHCVANMFYITAANMWSVKAALYLLLMTLGNSCGALIIPLCRMVKRRAEEEVKV